VEQYAGTRSDKQRVHGAAFPQSLAEANISIYSRKNDLVLDPFAGVGTTIDAAHKLGRKSLGLELNPEFVELARKDFKNKKTQRIVCDDVRNLRKHVSDSSVDFILTSPPYATLLKSIKGAFGYKWREHSDLSVVANPEPYSSHQSDLGNLNYAEFMNALQKIKQDCYRVLKPNCYSVWVIKDYRDLKNNTPYVNFHGDVIRAAELAGFTLWDIRIYDQTKFRPLVVLGYPSRNYYLNIGHSYILVFQKAPTLPTRR
jgi:DNA modification methylase